LVITNDAGEVFQPNPNDDGFSYVAPGPNVASFTSHLPTSSGGLQYNPGSLNIEFDIPVSGYAVPQGGSIIRVWGVGLRTLGKGAQLSGNSFYLYGGMQRGIAGVNGLANPAQSGLLAQGKIFQGFGNWQGVNQTIDMICNPGPAILSPPTGILFTWAQGVPLASALFSTLSAAYPGYQVSVNIAEGLVAAGPQSGVYSTFEEFAGYIQSQTKPMGDALGFDDYTGVEMTFYGNRIIVYDYTETPAAKQLNFQDLIGQPTWIAVATVSFKTILRADIQLGNDIIFPSGVITPYALTSPAAAIPGAPPRNSVLFQQAFTVSEIHHFANYRQADAESWNTTFTALSPE
jgi:hypothetical protein